MMTIFLTVFVNLCDNKLLCFLTFYLFDLRTYVNPGHQLFLYYTTYCKIQMYTIFIVLCTFFIIFISSDPLSYLDLNNCPCKSADLCLPIKGPPVREKEIFGFRDRDGPDFTNYNWTYIGNFYV